jgi:hypothetical protein
MSISNREDVNKYYHLINELVDDYIDKWKIRPSRLSSYLKPGGDRFNKFLMRNNLSEVKGADRILKDVIEDRVSMESDGVITFETFKYFESEQFKFDSMRECLYKGIEKADIKIEKIIADHFDTNLGSIDVIDSDKHLFKLEDWEGDDWKVVVYSKEDLDLIKNNIIDFLYSELNKKEIELTDKIKIDISDLIKLDSFSTMMNNKLTSEFLIENITDLLGDFKFKDERSGYFIWLSN